MKALTLNAAAACAGARWLAKVGSAVTGFKPGGEVYGVGDPGRWGTFAKQGGAAPRSPRCFPSTMR